MMPTNGHPSTSAGVKVAIAVTGGTDPKSGYAYAQLTMGVPPLTPNGHAIITDLHSRIAALAPLIVSQGLRADDARLGLAPELVARLRAYLVDVPDGLEPENWISAVVFRLLELGAQCSRGPVALEDRESIDDMTALERLEVSRDILLSLPGAHAGDLRYAIENLEAGILAVRR